MSANQIAHVRAVGLCGRPDCAVVVRSAFSKIILLLTFQVQDKFHRGKINNTKSHTIESDYPLCREIIFHVSVKHST